ncbi:MAG: chromosome segregation protein SMC [Saprospiraceae bacterium]
MRLKSLHIKGFKSFANDTILNFSEDVIGVVGPNGSGKSNIVDALRWVLGEQKSKELRLEAMGDVIFNGTKTKKESPTAMVAVTFDNDKRLLPTEYQTVTITRTLYRSGESEYRLNNVICRLKDINSLLIDTGIGSNSYAIIALGMVDDILADKDNSRRRMFEQAAGVSKYKIRKRETLLKLKNATEDLNRIDDLLFEIEGNLKTLEKQARRTQKYLDIKNEYKELSIDHAVASVHHLKQKYKGITEKLVIDQDTYRLNDAQLYQLLAKVEKEKKANADKEISLSDHQKLLNDLLHQIRSKENEKGLLTQKLGFKKQNKDQLYKNIADSEKEYAQVFIQVSNLTSRISDERSALEKLQVNLESSRTTYEAIKNNYNNAKIDFDIRQKEKQQIEKEIFDLEKNVAIHKNSIENYQREILRSKEALESKEKEFSNLSIQLKTLDQNIVIKEGELKKLEQDESSRKLNINTLTAKKDTFQDSLNNINRNIDSKQNEYDLLKGMIENFEGFPESIKFLNEHWKKDLVILSDILDVQDNYKAPIEFYLEQYLNHFIVSDLQEAKQGISLLKNSQKGKAHFFLMDKITPFIGGSLKHQGLSCAADYVQCAEKYRPLIDALLGNVYIYDGDIDDLHESESAITILSTSGTFIKHGATVSGGSVGLFEGKKIGRKQNLEKLSKFLIDQQQQKEKVTLAIQKTKEEISVLNASDLQAAIEKIKKEIQYIDQDRIRIQHQVKTFEQFMAESDQKLVLANDQIKIKQSEIASYEQMMQQLRKRVQELDTPQDGDPTDLDQLSQKMSSASEAFNQDNIALIRHQNLIENIEKDKEFKDLKISELSLKSENDKSKLMSEDRERIDIEDQLMQLDQSLKSLYVEKNNFQSTLGAAEQEYYRLRNDINTLEDQVKNLNKTQSELQHTIQQLKDQFTEQKFQIQAVSERIKIEFGVSINDFINQKPSEDHNFEEMTETLEKLKQKLQTYGDVNPLAVEAYHEMKVRYDNIVVQRKDILEAKDSLMDTIKEIETTATTRFMEAFDKIRTNFIDVFRSLFTEDDTCDLVLVDETNPLESDIEIVAKPKGKKPKSLSQLSGGEKTLTATALLFALYLLKPAPFCIFDEVDAPLDDANIQKFNNIIRKFCKESQFIIVTHNKSTMAEVNVLYGVYMSEPGVSAVSSVDFRSLKHEPVLEILQ